MAVNYTLADLRRNVRDLTGVYSTDIVTDTYINKQINDIYFELASMQNWSWVASVPANGLTTDASYPVFPATYHKLLSLKTAAKILRQAADDSNRADIYDKDGDELINLLYITDLQGNVSGAATTLDELSKFVRLLINVFDNTISTTFIQNKLNEEYRQLNEAYDWPWKTDAGFAANPVNLTYLNAAYARKDSTSNSTSTFNFAKILAYGVGARLSAELGKENLVKALQAEYDSILEEMKRVLLHYKKQTPAQIVNNVEEVNLENLISLTKQLIGDYTNDIPPALLQQWVIEEANNLAIERDWSFLRQEVTVEVPAGSDTITFEVDDMAVLGMFVVNGDNLTMDEVKHRPHLLDVDKTSPKYFYQEVSRNSIKIAPAPTKDETFLIRIRNYSSIGFAEDMSAAYTLFSPKFKMLIPYRVAVKGLAFTPNNPNAKNLIPLYQQSAYIQLQNMITYYQNSANSETIQLGVIGLDTRKYIPFFRVG